MPTDAGSSWFQPVLCYFHAQPRKPSLVFLDLFMLAGLVIEIGTVVNITLSWWNMKEKRFFSLMKTKLNTLETLSKGESSLSLNCDRMVVGETKNSKKRLSKCTRFLYWNCFATGNFRWCLLGLFYAKQQWETHTKHSLCILQTSTSMTKALLFYQKMTNVIYAS